jgi:hypothetical protein
MARAPASTPASLPIDGARAFPAPLGHVQFHDQVCFIPRHGFTPFHLRPAGSAEPLFVYMHLMLSANPPLSFSLLAWPNGVLRTGFE